MHHDPLYTVTLWPEVALAACMVTLPLEFGVITASTVQMLRVVMQLDVHPVVAVRIEARFS
jgi:hypothetical protein